MKNSLQMKGLKISATPLQMAGTNERRYEKTALAGILRHSDPFVIFLEGGWGLNEIMGWTTKMEASCCLRQCIRVARRILVFDYVHTDNIRELCHKRGNIILSKKIEDTYK